MEQQQALLDGEDPEMQANGENFETQDENHILHPSSRALFRYWETRRAENPAPRRDALDLKLIRQLVPHLYIGEYANRTRMYRWRLAGTAVCELYHRELTGTNMLAGWDSFENDVISRFLSGTLNSRQPAILRFRLTTDRDQIIGAEMVALPILAADEVTTHIFGGVFPFRDPWPLGYTEIARFELTAARHIWTENLPAAPARASETAPARRNFQVISGGLSRNPAQDL